MVVAAVWLRNVLVLLVLTNTCAVAVSPSAERASLIHEWVKLQQEELLDASPLPDDEIEPAAKNGHLKHYPAATEEDPRAFEPEAEHSSGGDEMDDLEMDPAAENGHLKHYPASTNEDPTAFDPEADHTKDKDDPGKGLEQVMAKLDVVRFR